MHFVYILRSEKDNKYYVGMTQNLEVRLKYHNSGKVRSTKDRIPLKIVYLEKYNTKEEARKRELYLKSYRGSREKLIILKSL